MKHIILILALVYTSGEASSQSLVSNIPAFIGQTQEEIIRLNSNFGNKQIFSHTDSLLFSSIEFEDVNSIIDYTFFTDNKNNCVGLAIQTKDKNAAATILSEIENSSYEKVAEKTGIQKLNGKEYKWDIQGNTDYFVFTVFETK